MSRRITGISLIAVSALLYAIRYLAAAIFGSGVSSWNRELFQAMLNYVGNGPVILSIVALICGIIYLAWAEVGVISASRKSTEYTVQKTPEN